ncbi:MAG: helix-turn-helix domain-containing protein [Nitrososphaerales archaeon]
MLDWKQKALEFFPALDVREEEAKVYLHLMENGEMETHDIADALEMSNEDLSRILKILLDKGFIINHPPPSSYTPLHPRMALTNAYQLIQQEYDKRLKEKRLMVDQISFLLEGIYEKRLLGTEPDKIAR